MDQSTAGTSGDVTFEDTRFHPDASALYPLARAMAARFGYTAELLLDGHLAELLRLRVAQLNPCAYCLILHTRVAHDIGIPPFLVAHLSAWQDSPSFTPRDKAALAYCESLTLFDTTVFASRHDELTRHFSPAEIAEIAAVVINMSVWTRIKLAQGTVPVDHRTALNHSGPERPPHER